MEALIVNYRLGRHTQRRNQCIIKVEGVKDRYQAAKFIGQKISWSSKQGKEIRGKIMSTHGDNGLVLAVFERSLPHAVGVKVKLED